MERITVSFTVSPGSFYLETYNDFLIPGTWDNVVPRDRLKGEM